MVFSHKINKCSDCLFLMMVECRCTIFRLMQNGYEVLQSRRDWISILCWLRHEDIIFIIFIIYVLTYSISSLIRNLIHLYPPKRPVGIDEVIQHLHSMNKDQVHIRQTLKRIHHNLYNSLLPLLAALRLELK